MLLTAHQPPLFGGGPPLIGRTFAGLRHQALARDAWVDHLPGWLQGHDEVFAVLSAGTRWQEQRRRMYERVVDVPRLVAQMPDDGPGHPVIGSMAEALSDRYGRDLTRVSLALYRGGRDSVAWHGDRLGRHTGSAVVAIVSVGSPRRFLLRPAAGGPSLAYDLGWGDLLVMGGTCQRTWEHAVPKVSWAEPRISIQFRETHETP